MTGDTKKNVENKGAATEQVALNKWCHPRFRPCTLRECSPLKVLECSFRTLWQATCCFVQFPLLFMFAVRYLGMHVLWGIGMSISMISVLGKIAVIYWHLRSEYNGIHTCPNQEV